MELILFVFVCESNQLRSGKLNYERNTLLMSFVRFFTFLDSELPSSKEKSSLKRDRTRIE